MKKGQYKYQKEKDYKKILIVLFIMIIVLSIFNAILGKIGKKIAEENTVTADTLDSIKDVILYYRSTYISENESSDKNFYVDAYVKFKVLPFEDDVSNEEYYNNLIRDCAKVIFYKNFKLIDRENNISISVICKNSAVDKIIINDIENYFVYMESQIDLKNYVDIPVTSFDVENSLLQECINNTWDFAEINFGTRDSIFEEYNVYFEEGYKVRTIKNKVYNIVFSNKYSDNIVNGLKVGYDFATIEAKLGKATFSDEDRTFIGYKGEKMYIFFSENEISVYRIDKSSSDEFFKLADDFLSENIDLLAFMNKLTYLWPDYSKYEYSSSSVYLSYPSKGIEIKINYDDTNGILVYNNIKSSLTKISRYMEDTTFVSRLKLDAICEVEKKRLNADKQLINDSKEYVNNLSNEEKNMIGESLTYFAYPVKDNNGYVYAIKFISRFGAGPNRELNDSVSSYLWVTSDYLLYSKYQKGIYFYNLNDGKVQRIISGKDDFTLKEYKDGILKYDNKEISLEF